MASTLIVHRRLETDGGRDIRGRTGTEERRQRHARGLAAEAAAALLLRLKGYRILGRRVRTPLGEVDIIARRGQTVAFVEVKRRDAHALGLQALHPAQARRLVQAARWWLAAHPAHAEGACRFDLVTVNRFLWPRHHAGFFAADDVHAGL